MKNIKNELKKKIFVFSLAFLALLPLSDIAYFDMGVPEWMKDMENNGATFEEMKEEGRRRWEAENGSAPTQTKPVTPTATATPTPTPTPKPKACSHTYTSEITTPPTCTVEGVRTFTCTNCGDTYTMPEPATGVHDFEEKVTKETTCTTKGVLTRTCKVCGLVETEDIETLGHDYESTQTKAPTCTEDGLVTDTCKRCGDVREATVPKLGHTEGQWEITTPAGLFTAGEQVIRCTTCGEILQTQVIASRFPIWYLYAGIAVVVLAAGLVVFLIVRKKA